MVFDERRDEIITVVVARLAAQRQWLTDAGAGAFEGFRPQLLGQELVGQPLVNQDAVGEGPSRPMGSGLARQSAQTPIPSGTVQGDAAP